MSPSIKHPIFTYHTLHNGLQCVIRHSTHAAEYCGLAINAGSRDDFPGMEGLAHFVEHTIFKGTLHRRAGHILNRMESVGGELNAYTTKELTMLYSVFPPGNMQRALELIADLVAYSQFPTSELTKEREVVADEIDTYLDMPCDAVYDDFEDLIFANSALGHNILGSKTSIDLFTTEACRNYVSRHYVPSQMALFYQGPESAAKVIKMAEKYFGVLNHPAPEQTRVKPTISEPFTVTRNIDSHQAHCVMGCRIPDMYSPSRHAISLLTNLVGGPGMNSMLNIALREKRGLVYSVEATSQFLTDAGLFMIYFGCDPEDAPRCLRLVNSVLRRIADTPPSGTALERAKRQYLGQMVLSHDSTEQTALGAARAVLYHGSAWTLEQMTERISSITADDMRTAAELMFAPSLSTLILR
ncbi:MAG: insulinase family protein [Paramuribaculum sp.]|nr:insulinase family protein [Paramuribaculum sp.]